MTKTYFTLIFLLVTTGLYCQTKEIHLHTYEISSNNLLNDFKHFKNMFLSDFDTKFYICTLNIDSVSEEDYIYEMYFQVSPAWAEIIEDLELSGVIIVDSTYFLLPSFQPLFWCHFKWGEKIKVDADSLPSLPRPRVSKGVLEVPMLSAANFVLSYKNGRLNLSIETNMDQKEE